MTAPFIDCRRCHTPTQWREGDGILAFLCEDCGYFQYPLFRADIGRCEADPRLHRAAARLGGTVTAMEADIPVPIADTFRGQVTMNVQLAVALGDGLPEGLWLFARTAPLPAIRFSRETWAERVWKKLRLASEPQLGEPALDALVWIETSLDEPQVQALLATSDARRALVRILEHPIEGSSPRITFGKHGVLAFVEHDTLDHDDALDGVTRAVATLAYAAKGA
jgi:hypothetical protein